MAKLKLKLDEFEYIEGTPEELADFIKIRAKQHEVKESTKTKKKEPPSDLLDKSSLIPPVEEKELIEFILPKEEEVISYITSKPDFEFHTVELQEKFLGKRVMVRENTKLYNAFDRIIRSVKKRIADKYSGAWDNRTTKSLGGKTHVTVYRFKKREELASASFEPSGAHHRIISEQA